MSRTGGSIVICLLVAIVIGGVLAVDTSPGYEGLASQVSGDSTTVQVIVEPEKDTLDRDGPTPFNVIFFNLPRSDSQIVWLTVGVSPSGEEFNASTDKLNVEVADQKPWYVAEGKLTWAKEVNLTPGEGEIINVIAYPGSKPGNYEINATASYLENGSYRKESDTSTLRVESPPTKSPTPTTRLPTNDDKPPIPDWMISLASLVVAILSFFGYERVRETVPRKGPAGESEQSGEQE